MRARQRRNPRIKVFMLATRHGRNGFCPLTFVVALYFQAYRWGFLREPVQSKSFYNGIDVLNWYPKIVEKLFYSLA
jgi:hypothetical protein